MATLICEKRGRKALSSEPRARKRSAAKPLSSGLKDVPGEALRGVEREWEGLVQAAAEDTALAEEQESQTRSAEIARLQALIQKACGKRWLLAQSRAAERAVHALQAPASVQAPPLDRYKQALRSLQSRQTLPSSLKPSRMERKTFSKATDSAVRAPTTRAARPSVLLMTPENAAQSLTMHLQAALLKAPPPLLLTVGDICDECGVQMKVIANDSMLGCGSCHKTRLLPNTTTVTVSSTGEFDYSSSAVHQKHRLPEWIEMAQAKQFAEPPLEVLESIVQHLASTQATGLTAKELQALKAERERGPFVDAADAVRRLRGAIPHIQAAMQRMQAGSVRRALKAMVQAGGSTRLRKYYEHSAKCAAYIGGYWPPRMNAQQEEILRLVYAAAAPAYEAKRKPTQSYWPGGFPYFLRASCALLGWDEFVPLFPLPPGSREGGSRHALRSEIWSELGWEVVPAYAPLPPIRLRSLSGEGYEPFQLLEDDGADDEEGSDEEPASSGKRRREQ